MRTGRPPLAWGTHGKITTRTVASGHVQAMTRLRLWDGELQRMTATAATAADARASLQVQIAERLRFSELDAWRHPTADDPFDELVYMWLGDLEWGSSVSEATYARCARIVRTQLVPTFGDLTVGEITAERIEPLLAAQRATSEAAAAVLYEVIELLLDLAVCEDVLDVNPMGSVAREGGPTRLGGLNVYRRLVHTRLENREQRRREACEADA